MATTTNYGWTTPDDTALVKDGASAIRALGTAIDTSMNTALGTKKSGLVLLNTISFSAVASQSVNDVFSSNYDRYRIMFDYAPSTSLTISFRFRVSGADNSTSNYQRQSLDAAGTSVSGGRTSNSTDWALSACGSNVNRSFYYMDVTQPFASVIKGAVGFQADNYNATTNYATLNAYGFNATTSFTGFSLICSTGNFTGSVSVFGYNK